MVKGRMFECGNWDDFYAHGVGAMFWDIVKGVRVLYFLAPPVGEKNTECKFSLGRIYAMTDGKDWTHQGSVSGWDGNLEQPTFTPSIWLNDRQGWHGWITKGNLIDA